MTDNPYVAPNSPATSEQVVMPIGLFLLAKFGGFVLALFGLLGSIAWLGTLIDPVGAQLSNDADPFGTPPMTLVICAWLVGWFGVLVTGCWLLLLRRKKHETR